MDSVHVRVNAFGTICRVDIPVPASLRRVIDALAARGGRPFIVGGAVRDALLGLPARDLDLEVFGLPADGVREVLAAFGPVNAVGEAFTVFKLSGLEGVEGAVDVSLPRRDSKAGPGHRGILVVGDPSLSLEEASRRRDFTINALLFDPVRGETHDPHGGARDLAAGILRAVDARHFGEDPLRALRAVQLAARFDLTVDPATAALVPVDAPSRAARRARPRRDREGCCCRRAVPRSACA